VNWDFHFFTFVGEVQLQLKTHCELEFSFHVCKWSAITTEDSLLTGIFISSRLWVKYNCNWRLTVNWDFYFFTFVSEVQLQLKTNCELGFPFLHVCEWSTITTEDSLWTGISISSRLWLKYNYNWRLTVNRDFHFFTFVGEVQLQLKTHCELGFPFLHVCEWSTVTTEDSLWTGIFISSRLWVKYNYNWKLIVNWDLHFFTLVSEVQLQLKTHCELGFPFLHVCVWSTVTIDRSFWTGISISSRLWVK